MKKEEKFEVTWNDAYHLAETWLSNGKIAEAYKETRFKVVSIGWKIFEDKKYIILAGKRSVDYGDWGFVMMIPKGMIVKTKVLK